MNRAFPNFKLVSFWGFCKVMGVKGCIVVVERKIGKGVGIFEECLRLVNGAR